MYNIVPADELRPLPPRPDLAYEEARARALRDSEMRADELRVGGLRDSVSREDANPNDDGLDEARAQVARDYGFASWSKLVAYYKTWELHELTGPRYRWDGISPYENRVGWIRNEINNRKAFATQPPDLQGTGATLATYVPRFFGLTDAEIFSAEIADAEIRHAVARSERFPNWEALAAFSATNVRRSREERELTPQWLASQALKANDRAECERLFMAHPELLRPNVPGGAQVSMLSTIVIYATRSPTEQAIETYRWLQSIGTNFQSTLNEMLLGWVRTPTDEVQNLLALGADPNWMPKNGYSVLEHAVYRYWNGEALDLLVQRTEPRKSFWLAAGIGDVDTMLQFIGHDGLPTEAARNDRPPFNALFLDAPSRPEASDLDVMWEAFMLACMNNRAATIDALLERGFPIDYAPHEMNMLRWAVGNWIPDVVEALIERGADPDYKPWPSVSSPREMAASWTKQDASNPIAQRLERLCTRGAA